MDEPALPATAPATSPADGSLGTEREGTGEQTTSNPDPLAAALNAGVPLAIEATPSDSKPLLDDLLTGLVDLKTKLEAGEPPNAKFLEELNARLDALGEALGIDLTAFSGMQALTAALATPAPEDASLAAKLAAGIAPVAALLVEGKAGPDPETAALGTQVGQKLAALLEALKDGAIPQSKLAEQGDADTRLALAKLMATKVEPPADLAAPVLAKPALQLDEPVLTGKSTEVPPAPTPTPSQGVETAPVTAADGQADPGTSGKDKSDGKPADDKTVAAAAITGATEPKPEAQAAPQSQQQSARIDPAAAPRLVQTGYQTSQQQLNLPQIAFELARQTSEGNTRFQIRLDPAELGRIDVQLEIDKAGQVNARLVVEKAETLDLMQRDQRGLEKALHQAGLDSSKTNLEFSLRQNNGREGQHPGRDGSGRQGPTGNGLVETAEQPPVVNLYRASLSASGVNIIA